MSVHVDVLMDVSVCVWLCVCVCVCLFECVYRVCCAHGAFYLVHCLRIVDKLLHALQVRIGGWLAGWLVDAL